MFLLVASVIAPVAGASLYGVFHDRPRFTRKFDGFMYAAIPALVVWQVTHLAMDGAGWIVFAVMVVGALTPLGVERISHLWFVHTDNVALTLGMTGLFLHAFMEGAALVPGGAGFSIAVVFHRILVGLTIWWLIRPRHGRGMASLGILALAVATAAGYFTGIQLIGHGDGAAFYQAFVAGMLVHVVFCQSRGDHHH